MRKALFDGKSIKNRQGVSPAGGYVVY